MVAVLLFHYSKQPESSAAMIPPTIFVWAWTDFQRDHTLEWWLWILVIFERCVTKIMDFVWCGRLANSNQSTFGLYTHKCDRSFRSALFRWFFDWMKSIHCTTIRLVGGVRWPFPVILTSILSRLIVNQPHGYEERLATNRLSVREMIRKIHIKDQTYWWQKCAVFLVVYEPHWTAKQYYLQR